MSGDWVAIVLEYQDRSVEQGHDDKRYVCTAATKWGVCPPCCTYTAAFPKLQLVTGSAIRCTKIADVFYLYGGVPR